MIFLEIITKEMTVLHSVERGILLSKALLQSGHAPDMPCGGRRRCGKCRVRASGNLSSVTVEERDTLTETELHEDIRLACCTQVLGNARVELAEDTTEQVCVSGAELDFEKESMFSILGAAIDIGTTTLAAQLYATGGLLSSAAMANPQRRFGADVISRVGLAMAGGMESLSETIREAIRRLLEKMCTEAGRLPKEIDGLVITGNTAMLHLLTKTDVSPLATAPFLAQELFGKEIPASELGLPCSPEAKVYLPRCLSAFVGADITTALLASGIGRRKQTALLVDIGTNGEIVLWHQGKLSCCSTAAGPAFEGASLSHGMTGGTGAIDHIWLKDGQLAFHTIGEAEARGICGSGVTDLLACLLETGVMEKSGCMANSKVAYSLTDRVSLSQADVRLVQLAKGAIRAGIETLLEHAGVFVSEVSRLAIAGGFGSYLSLKNAAAIGLLPPELITRSDVLGNAALSGASMILRGRRMQRDCECLDAKTIELAANPTFVEKYINYMSF